MTRRARAAGFAVAVGLAAMSVPGSPAVADPLPTLYDVAETCNVRQGSDSYIVGVATDLTALAEPDDGRHVDIDVLVLLDGVTQARAEQIFAEAARGCG